MAINQDIRLKFSSDQSNAIAGIGQLQGKMRSFAAEASSDIQNKISSIFSVVAIEEAIRRTGEWANSLQKASQELNISSEEFQALTRIFDKAGVGAEKIETFIDKITVAMDKAKHGSHELKKSLSQLGVTSNMSPNKAFETSMSNAGRNEHAMIDVFGGKNYYKAMAVSREMNSAGGSSQRYYDEHKEEFVSKEEVSSMAQNWESIVDDMKSIGSKLAPIATVLLAIIDGLLKMVNGIVGNVSFILKTLSGSTGLTSLFTGKNYVDVNDKNGKEIIRRNGKSIGWCCNIGSWSK